ncbi:hypothetical protein HF086_017453 [Spodoptera exigua]|uniref:Uncharacterized protein n=1 Tax=Spodoptera exigua TaxID=7107 RepID=A0A922M4E2_SPOEX|nr:hypothetical protein HF086_017453 [Spodoptera exigua]
MIQVVVLALVASSSAFTTHRYETHDNYRPITTLFSDIFAYENPRRHNDVRGEVYNQRAGFNGGGAGRVDTQHNYRNPYEWSNREVPWRAVIVTERANINNMFNTVNRDDNTMLPSNDRKPEQESTSTDINETRGTNDFNRTQFDANDPQLNMQSGDANRAPVINEQQITWNNERNRPVEDNANITTRSIHSNTNHSNSLHFSEIPSKPGLITNKTVANVTGVDQDNITGGESSRSNKTQSIDDKVTATDDVQRTNKNVDDDRWIWSNGEDTPVETTTIGLDDRAAFSGGSCPGGKVKVGSMCIDKD